MLRILRWNDERLVPYATKIADALAAYEERYGCKPGAVTVSIDAPVTENWFGVIPSGMIVRMNSQVRDGTVIVSEA